MKFLFLSILFFAASVFILIAKTNAVFALLVAVPGIIFLRFFFKHKKQ